MGLTVPEGESIMEGRHNSRQREQEAERSHLQPKQKAERKHRKWSDATVSHSQPSSDTLLQQALSPQVVITILNSVTN